MVPVTIGKVDPGWLRLYATAMARTRDHEKARDFADRVGGRFPDRIEDQFVELPPFSKRVPIAKVDEEQRIAWGWAYAYRDEHGEPVVDHSGQIIDPSDIRKMAERFVMESRRGGEIHKDHVGFVVHSLFIDDDVAKALGATTKKRGWFIGFKVLDDGAWAKVKDGTYRAFSIGGTADVEDLTDAA